MDNKRSWKRYLIGGIAALALVAGLAAAVMMAPDVINAQEGADEPAGRPMMRGRGGAFGPMHGGFDQGNMIERLAEKLDIPIDKVLEALESVRADLLGEAIEDGRVTQEQADRMQSQRALKGYMDIDPEQIMADVLGKTVEELQAAREDGTLRELLKDLDRDAMREAMEAARDSAIEAALEAGAITADQAELLSEEGPGFGMPDRFHGKGRRGGHGGVPGQDHPNFDSEDGPRFRGPRGFFHRPDSSDDDASFAPDVQPSIVPVSNL